MLRSRRGPAVTVFACLLGCVLAGCSSPLGEIETSTETKRDEADATRGRAEQLLIEARLGPAGGSIILGTAQTQDPALVGAVLRVPAGALDSDVTIKLYTASSLVGKDEVAVGPALRIEPAALSLKKAATVYLPYDRTLIRADDRYRIAHGSERSDVENPLRRVVIGSRAASSVATTSFGPFQAIVYRPPGMVTELAGSCLIRNIDVLFVIDNSPSMADKQAILANKVRTFQTELNNTINAILARHQPMDKKLSIHEGIITTDVGIGKVGGAGLGSYCTQNGDNGKLQTMECSQRPGIDTAKCTTACKKSIKLKPGLSSIDIDFDMAGNVTSSLDLPAGATLMDIESAAVDAFACRAFIGERGCGREAPFEAVRRALANNPGFFRYNQVGLEKYSILMLVVLTDEDDQSVADTAAPEKYLDLATTPGKKGMTKTFDNFDLDFRGYAMSTVCKMDTMRDNFLGAGALMSCREDPAQTFLRPLVLTGTQNVFADILGPAFNWNVLVAGIWSMGPTRLDIPDMDWMAMYGTSTEVPVELEFDTSGGATMEPNALRLKRQVCSAMNQMKRAPQHRLSRFATLSGMGIGPRQTLQADICNETEYQQALSLLATSLAPTGAMMCP